MIKKQTPLSYKFIVLIPFIFLLMLNGCDWSARWDLKRAAKVLDRAAELNAEFCGEHKAKKAYKAKK